MKKLITSIIALIVCATGANAATEFDLSGMSLDELIALRQQVQLAMRDTDEWQEVVVPEGIYQIGVDIPVGMWTMSSDVDAFITYGKSTDEYYTDIDGIIESERFWSGGGSVSWNLVEGTYLQIKFSPVIFTPYVSPELGFR